MASVRLAELLGRLSLAFDSADDAAPGKAVRSTVLAVELGKRAGASGEELRDTYWVTLLGYLGGSGLAEERNGRSASDASALQSAASMLDVAGAPATPLAVLRRISTNASLARALEAMARIFSDRPHVEQRHHASGDTVALPMRLHRIARSVEIAHQREGRRAALDIVRKHTNGDFDARLSKVLLEEHAALFDAIEDPAIFERFLGLEPPSVEWVDERQLDDVARALAIFADLSNPIFLMHSIGVAALAERAAAQLGLGAEETRTLRLAALLHDVGRVSVPNEIWARRGPLDWAAWERVRLHPYYTARVLGPIEALADVAEVASAVHERMDGSGYPQRRSARALSSGARVLAAAHVAFAMSEERPYRPALSSDAIARELVAEAALGRLDARAVDAVLASLGLPDRAAPASLHGLSERELEVSKLLVRGKSDKEIGALLKISPRTVQVHVGRILDKLGVRSRAGAAIWLIEHDLAS